MSMHVCSPLYVRPGGVPDMLYTQKAGNSTVQELLVCIYTTYGLFSVRVHMCGVLCVVCWFWVSFHNYLSLVYSTMHMYIHCMRAGAYRACEAGKGACNALWAR